MPVHRASNLLSALSLDLKIFKLAFKVILEGKIWLNSEICRFITQKSIWASTYGIVVLKQQPNL